MIFSAGIVYENAVSGTGATGATLVIEIICITVYLSCTYWVTIVHPMEIAVVWCVEIVYAVLIVLLCYTYLKSGRWMGRRV